MTSHLQPPTSNLVNKVNDKPRVCTIGLGYIGLPTSALLADNQIQVLGVDINPVVVDTINRGEIHIVENGLRDVVHRSVKAGYFKAATQPVESDVYLIVVPTPFKGNNEPDISYVEAATRAIIPLLKAGDLYIIESTSPVGTTEKMAALIAKERPDLVASDELRVASKESKTDSDNHSPLSTSHCSLRLSVAYCPERVLPGNVMHELVYNDRVIGGIDEASTEKAVQFYSQVVKGELHKTNARTAEMCKLTENASRDSQIAFANELSLICDKAGIDVWELIRLANKHPRVNILQPGCGVGGHCIAVDPWFIVSDYPMEAKMIGAARQINNYKSFWCAEKISEAIAQWRTCALRQVSSNESLVTSQSEQSERISYSPLVTTHSRPKVNSSSASVNDTSHSPLATSYSRPKVNSSSASVNDTSHSPLATSYSQPKVALMGLAFKPNIDDLRESPAKYIVGRVIQQETDVDFMIVEPNIEEHTVYKLTDYQKAVEQADIVVFLVAHKEFKDFQFNENQMVLDFCGVTK